MFPITNNRKDNTMDFAWAISALKAGLKVTRNSWKNSRLLWLKPAVRVEANWCHDPVLKALAEKEGGVPATDTISVCFQDAGGIWVVTTGWVPQQYDLFANDWQVYFGEGHEKQTPEEIEAYKKLMLDRMPGGPFSQQMLEIGALKAQQEKESVPGDTPILQFARETTGSSNVVPTSEVDRIVCAISDIAQFADDLAEGASEQLGIKVGKRNILVAIVDAIIQAGETGTPVEDLLQDAYEKALKAKDTNHA